MLGENGTGKTTFIRMLAGLLKPDCPPGAKQVELSGFSVSYKPQKISPSFEGSVRTLLMTKIKEAYGHPQVRSFGYARHPLHCTTRSDAPARAHAPRPPG